MNIEDVFAKLRPIMGEQIDSLWQEYLIADASIRQTIERTLRIILAQRLAETFKSEYVLLTPPPKQLANGRYSIGLIYYGGEVFYPFSLREEEFIQHIGIFGRSGSGKTNLAYLILTGLSKANKPFLVFDWKRNYRDLISLKCFDDLMIFTVGRNIAPFGFNPLIPPPGTQATVWLKKLIEIMCHAYFLGEGVSVLLMRAIDELYRQAGLYDGKPNSYPTMADVRDYLIAYKAKGREAGWMESAMRAVEVLCFGEMGRVLGSKQPYDIAKLLKHRIILELDALTNADKTFLIESLLLWIHHYRLAQGQREDFKHAIIIEEAHHILLRKKQEVTGEETVTDVLLREIRELGESIICLDQHPSLISKPALGNTYATFVFNLKHRSDTAMIQDCLHLDSQQTGYIGRLDVGWAIVKLQGRWVFPFLVKLPLIRMQKGAITDEHIRSRLATLAKWLKDNSAVISSNRADSRLHKTQDNSIRTIPTEDKKNNKNIDLKNDCAIQLTTQERQFLTNVWQHPTSSVTERYERLSFSRSRGNIIQTSLIRRGFLFAFSISSNTGRIKTLWLTEKAKWILGIEQSESSRHGGHEHRYWLKRIAEHLRNIGYKVIEEYPIGKGKTIDIFAERAGKRLAFEIETGKSNAEANVQKCLTAGIDKIIVIATSAEARKTIESKLTDYHGIKILSPNETITHLQTSR